MFHFISHLLLLKRKH